MSKYRQTFTKKTTLLPVIHVETVAQALHNVNIAVTEGADGVFLINHKIPSERLQRIYETIRGAHPNLWIGLNYLDIRHRASIYAVPLSAQGLWVDDAGMEEDLPDPAMEAQLRARIRKQHIPDVIYFGGVAFKYRKPVKDPAHMAELAAPFVDVVTTSGEGTGMAAEVEKIRLMKAAIGDHPLAIASGITPENVGSYLNYADCLLVATGISDSDTELNPAKLRALVKAIS